MLVKDLIKSVKKLKSNGGSSVFVGVGRFNLASMVDVRSRSGKFANLHFSLDASLPMGVDHFLDKLSELDGQLTSRNYSADFGYSHIGEPYIFMDGRIIIPDREHHKLTWGEK